MISIRELTKSFDANRAVDHISFDIPEGMMFGLLGTTVRKDDAPPSALRDTGAGMYTGSFMCLFR